MIDKNNEHFVDGSFNDFTDDYSIGYWLWDDDVMGAPPPGIVSFILAHQRSLIESELTQAGGALLMMPPEDAFWDEMKARLAKRAGIAAANETVAATLRDETAALEEKIRTYLEEHH